MGITTYISRVIWFRRIKSYHPEATIIKLGGGRYRITIPGLRFPFEYQDDIIYIEPSVARDMWFDINRDEYFNHIVNCNTLNKLKDGIKRKEI